jgi:hypothetical protein
MKRARENRLEDRPPIRRLPIGRTVAQPTNGVCRWSHVRDETGFSNAKGVAMDQTNHAGHSRRPEPIEMILSSTELALLHGLYDRPGGLAESSADLVRAAWPYTRMLGRPVAVDTMRVVMLRMSAGLMARTKLGGRNMWSLEDAGRAIIELQLPVFVRGYGRYAGLRAMRAPRSEG